MVTSTPSTTVMSDSLTGAARQVYESALLNSHSGRWLVPYRGTLVGSADREGALQVLNWPKGQGEEAWRVVGQRRRGLVMVRYVMVGGELRRDARLTVY